MAKSQTKRRRRKPRDEPVYYVVEVEDWDWSFSFGINDTKHFDDPYRDFRHLEISGKLILPAETKADKAALVLMPDHELNVGNRQRHQPRSVGSLHLNQGVLSGLLSIPQDALDTIVQTLAAGRLRFAVMTGDRLRYRQALLRSFRLQRQVDEDDLPSDSA